MLGLNQYLDVSITNFMVGCMSLVGPGDREGEHFRLDRGELRHPSPTSTQWSHSTHPTLSQPHCISICLQEAKSNRRIQGLAHLGPRSLPLYPW